MNRHLSRLPVTACWAGAIAVAARGVGGSIDVARSLAWLDAHQPPAQSAAGVGARFILVLPMLREQALIADTLAYFEKMIAARPGTVLLVVTTAREDAEREDHRGRLGLLANALAAGCPSGRIIARFAGVLPRDLLTRLAVECAGLDIATCQAAVTDAFTRFPTTRDLAVELVSEARERGLDVRHVHYPHTDGAMAHQVNYGAHRVLDKMDPDERARCWIGLYNADSRPHPDSLDVVAAHAASGAQIVQQPTLFTANLAEMPSGWSGSIAQGAALLQSRWTLAREIPRLRRQATAARTGRRIPLAHCVGHGLFVRGDLFTAWRGLPTETMNEDLALGFLACAAGIPIVPAQVPELAEAPTSTQALIRQGRQWFWSYPQYPMTAGLAKQRGLGNTSTRYRLAATGAGRGLMWLAQSPAIAVTLLLPLAQRAAAGSGRRTFAASVLSAASLAAYLGVPAALILNRCETRPPVGRVAGGLLGAALVSSVGPWLCLSDVIRQRLTGVAIAHDKTER